MSDLKLMVADVQRVRESIELTRDRYEKLGGDREDPRLDTLDWFCKEYLIGGGNIDTFLAGQDMEIPPN